MVYHTLQSAISIQVLSVASSFTKQASRFNKLKWAGNDSCYVRLGNFSTQRWQTNKVFCFLSLWPIQDCGYGTTPKSGALIIQSLYGCFF